MKRTLAITIGVLVAVVAAGVLVSAFFVSRPDIAKSSAAADETDIPPALKQRVDCMYQVLTAIPGIHQPRQGSVTRNGWTHPFIIYSSTLSGGGEDLMEFEAQRDGHNHDEYWYWFLGSFAGPIPPGFDVAQMESIIRRWEGRCHVWVEYQIN